MYEHLEIIPTTCENNDNFVGFKIIGNKIMFYYPMAISLDINSDFFISDVKNIIKTISIAKTYNSMGIGTDFRNNLAFMPIDSYIWLIEDFLNNNIDLNVSTISTYGAKGKIDWKKTLQKLPYINENCIFFQDIYCTKKIYQNDLYEMIYKICLRESIRIIGWLYNLNESYINLNYNNYNRTFLCKVIIDMLSKAFNDKRRERLIHLKNILNYEFSNSLFNEVIYGVDNYYFIFEKMVDKLLGNQSSISNFKPKGFWQIIADNLEKYNSSNLIPDTIYIENSKQKIICVIDSKYYKYGITKKNDDLPSTTSIQKQITYGKYIQEKYPEYQVLNVFILPYNKLNNKFGYKNNFELFGIAKSEWEQSNLLYSKIYCFFIDLKYLIQNYNNKSDENIKQILDQIDVIKRIL